MTEMERHQPEAIMFGWRKAKIENPGLEGLVLDLASDGSIESPQSCGKDFPSGLLGGLIGIHTRDLLACRALVPDGAPHLTDYLPGRADRAGLSMTVVRLNQRTP